MQWLAFVKDHLACIRPTSFILIEGEIACNLKVIANKFNDFFINIGPTLTERTQPP